LGLKERASAEFKIHEELKNKQNQLVSEWLSQNSQFIVEPQK
jgi:hypothetical protein